MSLNSLLKHHFQGTLAMWSNEVDLDVQAALVAAVNRMELAPQSEVRRVMTARMQHLVSSEERLRHNRYLNDNSWLTARVENMDDSSIEELGGGDDRKLLAALYDFDEDSREPNP